MGILVCKDVIENPRTKRNRLHLGMIFCVAAASLIGAYALFSLARTVGVWGTTNNGEFVRPSLTVADLVLVDALGNQPTAGPTWWLWVSAAERCDAGCRDALHQLRQLHVLLNKDAPRLRRMLVTGPGFRAQTVLADYPDMQHLEAAGGQLRDGIYIVDPIGNLVFYYSFAEAGKPVLEDLRQLLKVSQIG